MQESVVLQIVESAHAETSPSRSEALYLSAIEKCDAILKTEKANHVFVIKAQSFKELALQSQSLKSRNLLWTKCLDTLVKPLHQDVVPVLAENLAICTAEMLQDQFCDLEFSERRRRLRQSMNYVDDCLTKYTSSTVVATLLARKSSLLRSRAHLEMSPNQSRSTVQESRRCALKAVDTHDHAGAQFELALSHWALARTEPTDEGYVRCLNDAEHILVTDTVNRIEVARLMLPRFYRMTYRPLEASETFEVLERDVKHVRRFLASVNVYAESVIHLWFQDFPHSTVMAHANNALALSERAIDSGFRDARNVLNVAYLRAMHDGPKAGQIALRSLSLSDTSKFWDDVLRLSDSALSNDAVTQSFVMGIANSHVLTRLGTFVLHFIEDTALAGRLYELAVKLDPKNSVALTNQARYCLHHDPAFPREDIERLLQKAKTYSDRRFRWWRVVLDELNNRRTDADAPREPLEEIPAMSTDPSDLKRIRRRFKRIKRLGDAQKRGYELENLVFHLARLSFGIASPSYRFERGAESASQIDCYFEHRNDRYRVECKWTKTPLKPREYVYFLDSLDVAGISGLLISMSGFAASTIERAQEHRKERPMILVDGEEISMVFDGIINFDELLSLKRLHYDQRSETFYKVTELAASSSSGT